MHTVFSEVYNINKIPELDLCWSFVCQKEQTALPEVRAIPACTAKSMQELCTFLRLRRTWQGESYSCLYHMLVTASANKDGNPLPFLSGIEEGRFLCE
jgi:hypothetical protein